MSGLWLHDGATRASAGDPALDGGADRCVGRDVAGGHLVQEVAGGAAAGEVRVAVAAAGHKVVDGEVVGAGARQVDGGSRASTVGCLAHRTRDAAAGGG